MLTKEEGEAMSTQKDATTMGTEKCQECGVWLNSYLPARDGVHFSRTGEQPARKCKPKRLSEEMNALFNSAMDDLDAAPSAEPAPAPMDAHKWLRDKWPHRPMTTGGLPDEAFFPAIQPTRKEIENWLAEFARYAYSEIRRLEALIVNDEGTGWKQKAQGQSAKIEAGQPTAAPEGREPQLAKIASWLKSKADELSRQAASRMESEKDRNATVAELKQAKKFAEKMAGRELPLASVDQKSHKAYCDMQVRIGRRLESEAKQLSAWAELLHSYSEGQASERQQIAPEGRELGVLDEILLKLQRGDYGSRPTAPAMIMTALQAAYSAGIEDGRKQTLPEGSMTEASGDAEPHEDSRGIGREDVSSLTERQRPSKPHNEGSNPSSPSNSELEGWKAAHAQREKEAIEDAITRREMSESLASAAEREKRLGKALLRIQHLIGQFLFKSSRKAQLRIMNEIVQESETALSEVSAEQGSKEAGTSQAG